MSTVRIKRKHVLDSDSDDDDDAPSASVAVASVSNGSSEKENTVREKATTTQKGSSPHSPSRAAEETRLRRAARGDADDDDKTGSQEIELLAERSPEELEAEKVEQAKRDGNFFNLADSQPVDEDGPTLPSEPGNDADDTDDDATPRSFLERHARTLLPAVLRATLDASTQEKCDVLHATLSETAVAAL